jgi:hypothetical protein
MPRCPKGTRKNKSGNCIPVGSIVKQSRCPNGTRRNSNGECVSKKASSPSPKKQSPSKTSQDCVIYAINVLAHIVRLEKQHSEADDGTFLEPDMRLDLFTNALNQKYSNAEIEQHMLNDYF